MVTEVNKKECSTAKVQTPIKIISTHVSPPQPSKHSPYVDWLLNCYRLLFNFEHSNVFAAFVDGWGIDEFTTYERGKRLPLYFSHVQVCVHFHHLCYYSKLLGLPLYCIRVPPTGWATRGNLLVKTFQIDHCMIKECFRNRQTNLLLVLRAVCATGTIAAEPVLKGLERRQCSRVPKQSPTVFSYNASNEG